MTHSMVESVTYNQIQQNGNVMAEKQETEWIMISEVAEILGVTTRQGAHYILNHLPEDAPEIRKEEFFIGKNKIFRFAKSDIEALKELRNKNDN